MCEHLDVAIAEFFKVVWQFLSHDTPLRVMRGLDPRIHLIRKTWMAGSSPAITNFGYSTLIFASWMILRHFGSSDLTKLISSSGEPAIDWNR